MATKNDYIIVLVIAVLLLMASGCVGKKTTAVPGTGTAFAGGTDGLTLSFIPGEPLDEFYTGDDVKVGLLLENKGEYGTAAKKATVYVGGVSSSAFTPKPTFNTIYDKALDPVKITGTQKIPGGQDTIEFPQTGSMKYSDTVIGQFVDLTLTSAVCYPYQTQAIALACLSSNLLSQTVGKEICKISGEKNPQSAGAPVKVISAIELPTGQKKVGFQIKVKDVGGGFTYATDQTGDCRSTPVSKQNIVKVTAVIGGNVPTDCVNKDVRLVNGEGTVTCRTPSDLPADLVSGISQIPLTVTVDYKYMSEASKKIKVRKADV
ncbi:MAG: hypothetical protein AABX75_01635 [Nanoarchaeota archaeon]